MADAKISALVAATTPLAGTEVVPVVQSSSTKKVSIANLTAGRTVAMRNADLTGGAAVINIGATADNTYHYVRTIDNDGQAFYLGNDNAAGSFFSAGAYGRVLYSEGAKPLKVFVNGAYRAEYDTSGNYKLDTGNLVIGTAGKGIDFTQDPNPAGMTSELLDDYEEGTFSPTITSGITGVGYATQNGSYTKVGRLVTFALRLELNAGTAAAAIVRIGGLPFTSDGTYRGYAGAWAYAGSSIINSTSTNLPTLNIDAGGTTIAFYNTAGSAFNGTDLATASGFSVDLFGSYYS